MPNACGVAPPRLAAALLAVVFIAGCMSSAPVDLSRPPPAHTQRFVSHDYSVVMEYPDTVTAAHRFESNYFLGDRWNPDVAAGVPGTALLALTLPGSNKIRRATLRLGASDDTRAVDSCGRTPGREDADSVSIDGVPFTRVEQEDAGMSHYSRVRSYRGVHDNKCFAIDLFLTGTSPDVYDNALKEPFSMRRGMRRLENMLDGLSFIGNP